MKSCLGVVELVRRLSLTGVLKMVKCDRLSRGMCTAACAAVYPPTTTAAAAALDA